MTMILYRRLAISWLASTLIIFLNSCQGDGFPSGEYDVLIVNAVIIDGTGNLQYTGDVLIRGDSIAYIGSVKQSQVRVHQIIEANDMVLTPGFIDAHAHGDPLATPHFGNFLNMGITTICLGQDGFSHESGDIAAWAHQVDSLGVGVNVLTFIGHSTLRSLSGTAYEKVPSGEQLQTMKDLLSKGLAAGAFGMSTGLEYTPGYFAEAEEMAELAKVVGENKGIIMSHMRNEDDDQIERSIHELLLQGSYAPVHISHFKVVYGKGKERARYLLSILDSACQAGIQVTADVYPYTASYTGIGIVFPDWAKAPNDYNKMVSNRRKELKKFLYEKVMKRNGPEATLFGNGNWRGMTLKQVADSLQLSFEDVLIDVIGPEGASGAYFVMDEDLQSTLIQDSMVCISSDGSPTMHHPRGYGAFAKIINNYVNDKGSLTLAEAVRKMTSLPASILGLQDRGLVKVGYKADLLIFNSKDVIDKATFESPHQFAEGFDYVIVNGKLAKSPEESVRGKFGKFLRKQVNKI